jgi:phospholipase/lecithinase/hemolysin
VGYPFQVKQLALALCTAVLSTAACADYSKLVVFGDSMSDTHRLFEFTKLVFGKGFPAPPSYQGRISDGPVAVEYLARNLNIPLVDFAFAGATSGYDTLVLVPIGVLTQVNEYLNNNAVVPTITTVPLLSTILSKVPGTGRADPKALHMIWTGPDDFYRIGVGMNTGTSYSTAADIKQAVTSLYDAGARYFFIPLMPDLSLTPSARNHEKKKAGYTATALKCTDHFAGVLRQTLNELRARYPDAHIMSHDTLTFMRDEFTKVAAEGKNTTEACKAGGLDLVSMTSTPLTVCPDPQNYVFWDGNHPTTWVNTILGQSWAAAITTQP